ncbi:MAG: hypothetical protein IPH58_17315 [Sphingobacteriales bacterium]|jgi:hypothetical protein|nr:hypothetical protein [Sphingobacteriales bacterium]
MEDKGSITINFRTPYLSQFDSAVVVKISLISVPGKMVSVWFSKSANFPAASLNRLADSA